MTGEKVTRTRIAPVFLTAVLALTACSSEGGQATPGEASQADAELKEPGVPAEELSGLLVHHKGARGVFLTFHDVEDGTQRSLIDLTDLALDETSSVGIEAFWHKFSFSPDFEFAAYEHDGELRFGELNAETYSYDWTGLVEPEESATFSGGAIEYLSPSSPLTAANSGSRNSLRTVRRTHAFSLSMSQIRKGRPSTRATPHGVSRPFTESTHGC